MKKWIADPDGTNEDHWLDAILIDNVGTQYEDQSEYWCKAAIKWDGCIHFETSGNIPFSTKERMKRSKGACDDYIHICDLDQHIRDLIALRKLAKKHFKDSYEWNTKK